MQTATHSVEQDARRLAMQLEKYRYVVLVLLTIVDAVGAVLHAANKPLWYDEIITLIAASTPDAATCWRTSQQVDASPPLPHLLSHFTIGWFGNSELALRLPALVGFWIFCLCLFWFVRRRAGIFFGLAALLLPVATEAYNYSYEARAYGPELGFCGLALVCWQSAVDGRKRWLALVVLSLSMAGAILCHYYAVLLYVPIAGAEAYRSWKERRIDFGIWAAFVAGGAPVVLRMAAITHTVSGFSKSTWAPAQVGQVVEFWQVVLQHSLSFAVLGLVAVAREMMRESGPESADKPEVKEHELVAGVLFLAIPLLAVIGGLAVTHMFTNRYALIGITGIALLVPLTTAKVSRGRPMAGFLLALLTLLPLVFVTLDVPVARPVFADEPLLVKALEDGPVVLADGQTFLQLWHYAPERLRPRIQFIADSAAAEKYMGFDTLDGGIRVLTSWANVSVHDYKEFAVPGQEFRVYQNPLKASWLLSKLMADGAAINLENYTTFRQIYRVHFR